MVENKQFSDSDIEVAMLHRKVNDPMFGDHMIHDRGLYGKDGYNSILGISIEQVASEAMTNYQEFCWYDMACGQFLAGTSLALFLKEQFGPKVLDRVDGTIYRPVELIGIDIDKHATRGQLIEGVSFRWANIATFKPEASPDLITCVYGIQYIEEFGGDVVQMIDNWYQSLIDGGVIAFNLGDLENSRNLINLIREKLKSVNDREVQIECVGNACHITKPVESNQENKPLEE